VPYILSDQLKAIGDEAMGKQARLEARVSADVHALLKRMTESTGAV